MKRTSFRDTALIVLLAVIGLLIASALIVFNIYAARPLGGGGEFLLLWKATRAFLFEHADPYGGAVAGFVQKAVYGSAAVAGQNRYVLELPFYLLLL